MIQLFISWFTSVGQWLLTSTWFAPVAQWFMKNVMEGTLKHMISSATDSFFRIMHMMSTVSKRVKILLLILAILIAVYILLQLLNH